MLKGSEQKKFIRLRSLEDGFSEEDIRAVINGEKVITRTGKKRVKDEKSINRLVDI